MKKLFTRFFFSFLILILSTLVTTAVLSIREVKTATSDILIELSEQTVSARADQIGFWLQQRIAELKVLAETERFQELLQSEQYAEVEDFAEKHRDNYESVGLVLDNGVVLVSGGEKIDISGRRYYVKMTERNPDFIISSPIISRSDESYIAVVLLRSGDIIVSGAILLSWLSDIIGRIELKGQKAFIMDESGLIVAHQDHDRLMNFELESQTADDYFRITRKIPSTDSWFLTVDLPKRVLFSEVDALMRNMIGTSLAMAVLGLILALYLSKSLTKPIRNLQALMFSAERGNLEVKASALRLDEIGRLESSFNSMIGRMNELMERVRFQQSELRRKELESMMNQIKPHFLYNTLDSVRWMAEEHGDRQVARTIEAMSKLFRISLSGGTELIPLKQELKHAESYLKIQQMRYNNSFSFEISGTTEPDNFSVIKLILQPIIENSINHGILMNKGCGLIMVEYEENGEQLSLRVKDNGPGFREGYSLNSSARSGYGMSNVAERLRMHFGDDFGINIGYEGTGDSRLTVVSIVHPVLQREGSGVEY